MENNNTRQSLEQGRANFAFICAEKGNKLADFKSAAKKAPMMIKNHGLGAALAFMYSKGGNLSVITGYIQDWLKEDSNNKQLIDLSKNDLVYKITEVDTATYRAVTIEVLAFLNWLRRFADGLSKGN